MIIRNQVKRTLKASSLNGREQEAPGKMDVSDIGPYPFSDWDHQKNTTVFATLQHGNLFTAAMHSGRKNAHLGALFNLRLMKK